MENKKQHPHPTYEEFSNMLHSFKFPQETNSYFELSESMRRLQVLFSIAMRGGMSWVRDFWCELNLAKDREVQQVREKLVREKLAAVDEAWITGDEEFDNFRRKLRFHDWYYDYSDDGDVGRRGHRSEQELLKIVEEKGGIYEAAFKYEKAKAFNREVR